MVDLQLKIANLPTDSGVYIMHDRNGSIIYVGKAKCLKNRVRQYFTQSGQVNDKVRAMMQQVCDLEYIITNSELDALTLEATLIRKHQPRYNILLKDKEFPYIRIDLSKKYPKLEIVRKLKRDNAKYFGPYIGGINANDLLEIARLSYAIPDCAVNLEKPPKSQRPCLNYSIKRCSAPCCGMINEKEYHKTINQVIRFLEGKDESIEEILNAKMMSAVEREDFETAILYRDKLKVLNKLNEKRLLSFRCFENMDVIAIAKNNYFYVLAMLYVRGGKMIGHYNYLSENLELSESEFLLSFIKQYYIHELPPTETIVGVTMENAKAVEEWYHQETNQKIHLVFPQKGNKKQLILMAQKNAEDYLAKNTLSERNKYQYTLGACKELSDILHLPNPIVRMECYDISNTSGIFKTASMVVFENGLPKKSDYRKFKIKTVEGMNDFASMKEVLLRRLNRLTGNDPSFSQKPDLIVVDGGKGQLSYAIDAMQEASIDIPIISLAKREEEVFIPHQTEPIIIPKNQQSLKLLQRIRDEAHRFAITFHRTLRDKYSMESVLDKIPSVGLKRKKALMRHFRSIEKIVTASKDELAEVEGIPMSVAEQVWKFFHKQEAEHEI